MGIINLVIATFVCVHGDGDGGSSGNALHKGTVSPMQNERTSAHSNVK